jgi:pyruvate dehydrogenase E2 component (dihydrolipoamide acetyltransferase)
MADITMPQLGETVTEGTITRWAKSVGDRVEEDEVLFEVSTDKVDSEVPSPAAGVLREILVQEGETADVGAKLAVIEDGASADGDSGGGQAASAPAATAEPRAEDNGTKATTDAEPEREAAAQPEPEPERESEPEPEREPEPGAQPVPERVRAESAGDGSRAAPAEAAAPAQGAAAPAATATQGGGGTQGQVLSPVVRRLLKEHELSPEEIRPTGAGGRITRADVLAVIDARGAGGPPPPGGTPAREAPAPAPARQPAAEAPAPAAAGDGKPTSRRDETIAFTNIRRRTAEHMRRSLDTSAHTLVVIEVDYDNVDKARLPARARFKEEEGFSLTYLPFVARAVVDAIRDFPHVNSSVGENELVVHHYVNLGIAVDLNLEGLIVPVVHDADDKRLRALAREISGLAARARARKLSADDISGGTFTITNPGGYGTLITAPIINQPQVAILSSDGVRQKPVAVALPGGGYGVAVHPVGNLAIAFDHRAVDGAYASAFLARVRDVLETRDWAQELT